MSVNTEACPRLTFFFFPSSSCGDGGSRPIQFYVDTVKQMAVCQLIAGSPLRTLCLLIAGQPAEVFSAGNTSEISVPGAVNTPQQPAQVRYLFKIAYWMLLPLS